MGKWILKWGVWNGTIASREPGMPEEYDSRKDVINALGKKEEYFLTIGYSIWYADLVLPNGETENIK